MKKAPSVIENLTRRGVIIDSESPSLFGYAVEGHFPIDEQRKLTFTLLYLGLSKKAMIHIAFPLYHRGDEIMEEHYNRRFPQEKNMWGRSTPNFRQAIKDYMRGQDLCPPERRNYIGIDDEKGIVEIRLQSKGKKMGEEGFLYALQVMEYELEKGQLHRDVLTHLFA